jgi:hypothetical protein
MNIEEQFTEAENSWDLPRLYTDLGKAKGKAITEKEKLYLRGLLCGYGPAEIAKKCHKSAGALKVNFSKTLYQYVKIIVHKENENVKNWTNIREWLEESGYKYSVNKSPKSSMGSLSKNNYNSNSSRKNNFLSIYAPKATSINVTNNRINITFGDGAKIMDFNFRLTISDSSDSSEED